MTEIEMQKVRFAFSLVSDHLEAEWAKHRGDSDDDIAFREGMCVVLLAAKDVRDWLKQLQLESITENFRRAVCQSTNSCGTRCKSNKSNNKSITAATNK